MIRFVDELVGVIPDCPEVVIKTKVRDAAIQFCIESLAYRLDAEEDITEDDTSVTLTPTTNTSIEAIVSCTKDDIPFSDYTRAAAVITFDDAATIDWTLNVTMALKPDRDVTALPDVFYTDWYYAVYHKAAATLYSMPGKPWTSEKNAAVNYSQYIKYLNEARINSRKKNDMTGYTVAMRSW